MLLGAADAAGAVAVAVVVDVAAAGAGAPAAAGFAVVVVMAVLRMLMLPAGVSMLTWTMPKSLLMVVVCGGKDGGKDDEAVDAVDGDDEAL